LGRRSLHRNGVSRGEDLAARLERFGRLPHGQTARIIAQVAKGLGRAHAAGIVHRDLKPENVFLTKDGDDDVVKVLDFGIAKRSQTSLSEAGTKTGSLLGTPFHMSPEQARGVKGIDHRSDLFSLAIIAYQCVTGRLPFYSEGLGDVLAQIMYEPIPVPSQHAEGVPPAFDAWWLRASARAVEERFQSAKEMADSLSIALGITGPIDIPLLEPRSRDFSSRSFGRGHPLAADAARIARSPLVGRSAHDRSAVYTHVRSHGFPKRHAPQEDPPPGSHRSRAVGSRSGGLDQEPTIDERRG
jgi:serine/threonine protein kinase